MQNNHRGTNKNRHQDIKPNAGENKRDDGEYREGGEDEAVVEGAAEDHNRAVTEEEEEEPSGEDGEENDEREWMPKEAEKED